MMFTPDDEWTMEHLIRATRPTATGRVKEIIWKLDGSPTDPYWTLVSQQIIEKDNSE